MNFTIRWDLLSDDELDFLQEVGVEMHPSGMGFTGTPTWDDFTIVFAYLYNLERRTRQKENHIHFAIGDCYNAGSDFFGENKVDEWVQEFLKSQALRDIVINMTGGTMILLQILEHQIKLCCAVIELEGLKLTFEDISTNPSRRKKTLGQLIKALKQNGIFVPEFEGRLTDFVNSRNEFIHNLWVEKIFYSSKEDFDAEDFNTIYKFIQSLIQEAHYVRNVFLGFQYDLIRGAAASQNLDLDTLAPLNHWAKYIAEFRDILRDTPKDT